MVTDPQQRRALVVEIVVLLAVTLGLSGLRSLLALLDALLAPGSLADQSVAINAPVRRTELLDLAYQLTGVTQLLAWGALGGYLLWRGGIAPRDLGLGRQPTGRDAGLGVGLAAVIGVPGLGLYLLAHAAGLNLTVLPSALADTWWRVPVLVASAVANALAEELLVVGYLITRLRQLGSGEGGAVLASAALRGSYHLYQGFGGFLGNLVMGLGFGRLWQRTNRLWPLITAHALLDTVTFVGYALLHSHIIWLP
ncbi:MAG: CPBP family intramembrane metalloprotease [Pseudonocardiales bacterium]|nr:CPBP family intramembrane metalloprotease [Pseudonocardiales bacterium]MBW0008824.1 CPBP family intramembrane metalloprotease [Pseudonocardiales bacterium]